MRRKRFRLPDFALKRGGAHSLGSFSALLPALPAGSRKHFGEHFFGTFGPELVEGPSGWSAESQFFPRK